MKNKITALLSGIIVGAVINTSLNLHGFASAPVQSLAALMTTLLCWWIVMDVFLDDDEEDEKTVFRSETVLMAAGAAVLFGLTDELLGGAVSVAAKPYIKSNLVDIDKAILYFADAVLLFPALVEISMREVFAHGNEAGIRTAVKIMLFTAIELLLFAVLPVQKIIMLGIIHFIVIIGGLLKFSDRTDRKRIYQWVLSLFLYLVPWTLTIILFYGNRGHSAFAPSGRQIMDLIYSGLTTDGLMRYLFAMSVVLISIGALFPLRYHRNSLIFLASWCFLFIYLVVYAVFDSNFLGENYGCFIGIMAGILARCAYESFVIRSIMEMKVTKLSDIVPDSDDGIAATFDEDSSQEISIYDIEGKKELDPEDDLFMDDLKILYRGITVWAEGDSLFYEGVRYVVLTINRQILVFFSDQGKWKEVDDLEITKKVLDEVRSLEMPYYMEMLTTK